MNCPYCGENEKIQSRGVKANGKRQYYCSNENTQVHQTQSRYFVTEEVISSEDVEISAPKILLFDLETSHIEAYVKSFSLWEVNIKPDEIVKDWMVLCFSAKWLYDTETISFACDQNEIKKWNDKRIIGELWKLLDEADIIIAHNIAFDLKKSMTRFLYHNIIPPSHFKQICTLKMARNYFSITRNTLDYLGEYLGLGRKIKNEQGLWDKVETWNHPEHVQSMKNMVEYCEQDVSLLEKVFLKMRPFAKNNPNLSLYGSSEDNHTCPYCASEGTIDWSDKLYENRYPSGRCSSCNAPVIGRENKMTKEKRKTITKSK
jgi:DNA polymerase III epsilon subunit-like protein